MGNVDQQSSSSFSACDTSDHKNQYIARKRNQPSTSRFSRHLLTHWILFVAVGSMVSAWLLAKVFVAFAPLTCVQGRYSKPALPSLLDATAEELTAGLEAGAYTSLDLVQASTPPSLQVVSTVDELCLYAQC